MFQKSFSPWVVGCKQRRNPIGMSIIDDIISATARPVDVKVYFYIYIIIKDPLLNNKHKMFEDFTLRLS